MTKVTIEVSLDPADLSEEERKTLEANAHLACRSVPTHVMQILKEHLQGFRVRLNPQQEGAQAA